MNYRFVSGVARNDKTDCKVLSGHRTSPLFHINFLRLFIPVLLITICNTAFTNTVYFKGEKPELLCSRIGNDEIEIYFQAGEYTWDDSGNIRLNKSWQKYRMEESGTPVLAINLAIDDMADYTAEITEETEIQHKAVDLQIPDKNNPKISLGKPYIYRDIRGITLYISPFRVKKDSIFTSTEMKIILTKTGQTGANPKLKTTSKLNPYFIDNYKYLFLNFDARYEDIGEVGSMAVICYGSFMNQMIPYVNWKRQKGIPTQIYAVSSIGESHEEIKSFIQNLYDTDSTLTFVQLVGDFEQVSSLIAGDSNSYGPRDPYYAMLEGDDNYPDIFVGRFSAETVAELNTQIVRTLEYEQGMHAESWLSRASVACSNNPPITGDDDEHNWDHLRNIRTKLLNYTYSEVDSVFANWGADTQDLANSINAGKSLLIYTGEGYETYWLAPEFDIEDVENLTNDNMLPFIQCVSCYVGQFEGMTCLSEAFMRAENPLTNEPTGAIGVYASAPTQTVAEPMRSQDHFIDLLVNGTKNTMGGLCYNGSCNMIDVYGDIGEYLMLGWNLFGDASLVLRTALPDSLVVTVNSIIVPGTTSLTVQTSKQDVLVCLTRNNIIIASGFTDSNGAVSLQWTKPTVTGETYKLTCTGFNCNVFEKTILCYAAGEAYLTIPDYTFFDNEDGIINSGEDIDLRARVYNSSLVPAEDVYVKMVCSDSLLVITKHTDNLGTINSYESDYAHLEFSISKYCPDYRLIQYDIITHFGADSLVFPCQIMVKSPRPEIISVKTLPEFNWLNPGDGAVIQYEIRNNGSAKLKETVCHLVSNNSCVQILQPEKNISTISPDSTYVLSFSIRIKDDTETNTLFCLDMFAESICVPDILYSENHMVIPAGEMMESFESGMEERFSWMFPLGNQWEISDKSYEGRQSLKTPCLAVNQTSTAELSFDLQEPKMIIFHYKTDIVNSGSCLKFYINSELQDSWSGISDWQEVSFNLSQGFNTLSWRFESSASNLSNEDCAWLDAVRFPAGTVFSDAILEPDIPAIEITVHPDQIIHTPIFLSSTDGKYIEYTAVIRNVNDKKRDNGSTYLVSNRNDFVPGDYDRYILTYYNTRQDRLTKQIRIQIPEGIVVTSASNFSMSGQSPLTLISSIGSEKTIIWSKLNGTEADSLRCVLTLLSDISLDEIELDFEIITIDSEYHYFYENSMLIFSGNTESPDYLKLSPISGSLIESETTRLTISCKQEQLPQDASDYVLDIYYNGINALSIPITITYDPTPGIDTSKPTIRIYPNPFSRFTTIDYYLPEEGKPDITIYNIKGQKVFSFPNLPKYAGNNKLVWDLKLNNNQNLPSGVYLIKLKTNTGKEKMKKCLLFK